MESRGEGYHLHRVLRLAHAGPATKAVLLANRRREELARGREGQAVDETRDGHREQRRQRALRLVARPESQLAVARAADDHIGERRRGERSDPIRPPVGVRAVGHFDGGERPLALRRPKRQRAVLPRGYKRLGVQQRDRVDRRRVATSEEKLHLLGNLPEAHGAILARRDDHVLTQRVHRRDCLLVTVQRLHVPSLHAVPHAHLPVRRARVHLRRGGVAPYGEGVDGPTVALELRHHAARRHLP